MIPDSKHAHSKTSNERRPPTAPKIVFEEFCSSARTNKVDPQMLGNKHRHEYIIVHNRTHRTHTKNPRGHHWRGLFLSGTCTRRECARTRRTHAATIGAGCSRRECHTLTRPVPARCSPQPQWRDSISIDGAGFGALVHRNQNGAMPSNLMCNLLARFHVNRRGAYKIG